MYRYIRSRFYYRINTPTFVQTNVARRIRRRSSQIERFRSIRLDLRTNSNLVDPASSHTLVSKIKPCMCKYKRLYTVKLRTAHYISYSLFDTYLTTWITVVILELIHARNPDFSEGMYLLDINQPASAVFGES